MSRDELLLPGQPEQEDPLIKLIKRLYDEEVAAQERFFIYTNIDPQLLFALYRADPQFKEMYSALYGEFATLAGDLQLNERTKECGWRLYEDLAYKISAGSNSAESLLFSPQRTRDFLASAADQVVPELPEKLLQQMTTTFHGLELPRDRDELFFDKAYIYTSTKNRGYLNTGAQRFIKSQEIFPDILGSAKLVIMVPGEHPMTRLDNIPPESYTYETVPFTARDFNDFLNKVLYTYQGVDLQTNQNLPTLYGQQCQLRSDAGQTAPSLWVK